MLVSVIIPSLAWDAHLDDAVASVEAQALPPDVHVEVAVALAEPDTAPPRDGVLVIANPTGSIPVGLNLALQATTGDVVVRVDSRCLLPTDHVARMVEGLAEPAIGSVGGAQLVIDRGRLGSAYAVAFNSPLLGPSRYRFSRTSATTDSPYLGAWRRGTLVAVGGFDERLTRNQDNDLAERIQDHGLEVRYDADAVVGYVSGRSFVGTLRHHYSFGWWRMAQRSQGGHGLAPRHVAAVGGAALAAGAGIAAVLGPRTRSRALAAGTAAYAMAAVGAWRTSSTLAAARPDLDLAPLHPVGVLAAPALATAIDAAWLWGLVRGRSASGQPQPVEAGGGLRPRPG